MSFVSAIKNIFKRKTTVTFHLKSGEKIVAKMDDITIQKSGNDLRAMEYKGLKSGSLFYIRLDDISAITCK